MPPHSESSSSSSSLSSSATTGTDHHHETRFVLVNPPTIFAEASKSGSNMSHRSSRTVHGKTNEDNGNFVFFDAAAPQPEHQDNNNKPALDKNLAFKNKVRAGGGAKGKEGSSDFTRGKSQFARPCTVGWKSQNQPLRKGGGNRTPL